MDNIHGRQACANAMRRKYWVRLGFRGVAGVLSMGLYFLLPAEFALLEGMFFFGRLSILHLFWLIWMADMLCKTAVAVVLTGEAAGQINAAISASPYYRPETVPVVHVPEFDEAVRTAARMARPGEAVLLSPGCTSFDAFRNFEERGERFKAVVNALEEEA